MLNKTSVRKTLIYLVILILILRALFVPLFFPLGTPGFGLQAVTYIICAYLASKWFLKDGSKWKIAAVLLVPLIVDFSLFVMIKMETYGDFPYYPRYVIMSIPLIFGIAVCFFLKDGKRLSNGKM